MMLSMFTTGIRMLAVADDSSLTMEEKRKFLKLRHSLRCEPLEARLGCADAVGEYGVADTPCVILYEISIGLADKKCP